MTPALPMDDTEQRPAEASDSEFEHEVMAQCIEAWHAGGTAAVDSVLAKHAALAARLRERMAKLERAGLLGPCDDATAAIPEQLGEFRLLRRLGSGGMGVVFLAEQVTLGRTVALKLVRPEQRFFPGARARFRREVEAIARLGDAGIVPIYSVGEDHGVDFFAMEYVRGASLGDVLAAVHATPAANLLGRDVAVVAAARAEVPMPTQLAELFSGTWVQTCCRLVARMARAAHHAHERGVVHRDLKPNNTMVTPEGRVLLLDFGLAAAAGSSRITRSGAMLGTLHYMAPEQLLDGATDARTDVYALGVTLHELLALRPPFHAESSERLRQQILHGVASPLRERNSDVPRDVVTIISVAMDRDPVRRYATAQAFAEDLERFLQHRPIAARPIGPFLRAVRWSQRHPAAATAITLLLVALVATPFLVQWSRGAADQQIATAKEQARTNLSSAVDAVDGILASTRTQTMTRTPGLDVERARQINDAVRLMQRLRRENGDDIAVQTLFLRGVTRVADFRRLVGDTDGALAVLDEAEPVYAQLRVQPPDAAALAVDYAGWRLTRASVMGDVGRLQESRRCLQEVVDAHAGQDGKAMRPDLVWMLSTCHNNLGRIAQGDGEHAEALRHLQRSVELEAMVPRAAASLGHALDNVRTQINIGTLHRQQGDAVAARAQYDRVLVTLLAMSKAHPGEPECKRETARVQFGVAALSAAAKDFATSLPAAQAAISMMQELVAAFPDRAGYQQELGVMGNEQSMDRQLSGDLPGAETTACAAVATHELLVLKHPNNLEYGSQLAAFLRQLSGVIWHQQRVPEATKVLERAVALADEIVTKRTEDPHYHMQSAALLQEVGLYYWNAETWPQARSAWQRAARHYDEVLAKGSQAPNDPRRYPRLLMVLAQAELMCDDIDGVMRVLQRMHALQPVPGARLRELGNRLHVEDRADFQELLRAAESKPEPAKK